MPWYQPQGHHPFFFQSYCTLAGKSVIYQSWRNHTKPTFNLPYLSLSFTKSVQLSCLLLVRLRVKTSFLRRKPFSFKLVTNFVL